ncbi:MAG: hypothetical protein CML42_00445 [Rhodobacteraceae bacterium]|nr:hypothetical protein [Paracoccaceae bacterium]|tara:strand:+ start:114 stop:1277 length:1164 start_codon:yes stop_codon:yes gene_type:complete
MVDRNDIIHNIITDTKNRKKNRNVFASIHSAPTTYYPDMWKGKKKTFDVDNLIGAFTAIVPENTIVFTFTPTDNLAWSDHCQEKNEIMKNLRNSNWPWFDDWPLQRNAKVYLPGQPMYNQACSFDADDMSYFDIYTMYGNPVNVKKLGKNMGYAGKASQFKTENMSRPTKRTTRMQTRNNPNKYFYRDVLKEKVFTIQELINRFKSDPTKDRPLRIIYIYSCNPNIEDVNVKKITKNKIKQDEIIAMNYFCRRTYEKQGRDRFVDMFLIDKQEAIITKSKGKQDKDYFDIDKEKRQMLRTLMYIDRNKEHISDYEKSLKYGVTENGVLCKTKCKSSMCSAFGCGDKEDTCINVYGKKEKCYFPKDNRKAKKSRKKKRRKKKNKTKKK